MIFSESIFSAADNTGALILKCINVYNTKSRNGSKPANLLLVLIKTLRLHRKVKVGDLKKALFVRGTKYVSRFTGMSVKFNTNSAIIVNEKKIPLSGRIFGPIYKELFFDENLLKFHFLINSTF